MELEFKIRNKLPFQHILLTYALHAYNSEFDLTNWKSPFDRGKKWQCGKASWGSCVVWCGVVWWKVNRVRKQNVKWNWLSEPDRIVFITQWLLITQCSLDGDEGVKNLWWVIITFPKGIPISHHIRTRKGIHTSN